MENSDVIIICSHPNSSPDWMKTVAEDQTFCLVLRYAFIIDTYHAKYLV